MKGKWTLLGSIVAVLVLALAAGLTQAQGPEPPGEGVQPQGEVGIQALMGTAFTYQGYLKKGGTPYNGNCDFVFSLWDAATEGNQIGSNQDRLNVSVSNGLFTVQLDFGADAFQGDARWLWVRVRCPAGGGDYTILDPRQPLTPAPYALALPGLRTVQHVTSPSVIGGYSGNWLFWGSNGATIGGGGQSGEANRVMAAFGTVSGGRDNQAGGDAVVGGGRTNVASGENATVGGGYQNTASGTAATVGGGRQNSASGLDAIVGGGIANIAGGSRATVGGGYGNIASGTAATVGGGQVNTASGEDATVGGGIWNLASGDYATIPGGHGAAATHYGEMAYASGGFSYRGDAQTSFYVMRIERTCELGTWYDLYLNGNGTPSQFLTIAPGRTVAFDALVVGRTQGGESAGYYIRGVVENVGGTVSFIGTPVVTLLGKDDSNWNVQAVASDVYDALFIQVQGNGETIRWVATVRTAEVSW